MACGDYDRLSEDVARAMMSEDMARQSSPKQYPYNSTVKRQEAIDRAARGVHQVYGRRNAHIGECETCKADGRRRVALHRLGGTIGG